MSRMLVFVLCALIYSGIGIHMGFMWSRKWTSIVKWRFVDSVAVMFLAIIWLPLLVVATIVSVVDAIGGSRE